MPISGGTNENGVGTYPGTVKTRSSEPLFGKYRGRVVATNDPAMRGRIKAQVPFPFGSVPTVWAEPAMAPGEFNPPSVGDGVWIEFEMGNRELPIWSGCWFREAEGPQQHPYTELQLNDEEAHTTPEEDTYHSAYHDHKTQWYTPHRRVWASPTGHTIVFEDWRNADGSPGVGRISITHRNGMSMELREEGQIEINAGSFANVTLDETEMTVAMRSGETSIVINGDAQTVDIIGNADTSLRMDAATKVVTILSGTIVIDPGAGQVVLGSAVDDVDALPLMTKADADKIQHDILALQNFLLLHTHPVPGAATSLPPAVPAPPVLQYSILQELTKHVKGK
jgi:type VI secretion system (T6SS) baseplate-like injector VgrG